MARSFVDIVPQQYIGIPSPNPINLQGLVGQSVFLSFDWTVYGASPLNSSISVFVDLTGSLTQKSLRKIKSVYIDNMGSNNPVYMFFPDTGYTLVTKPNSAGWFRVYTGDLKFFVIGTGFIAVDVPTTNILVTNIDITPSIDDEQLQTAVLFKASPSITQGKSIYNTAFATPALGDALVAGLIDVSIPGNVVNVFVASGHVFLYITGMTWNWTSINAGASPSVVFEDTGVGGPILEVATNAPAFMPFPPMQLRLDGSTNKRLRVVNAAGTGFLRFYCSSTLTPI